MLGCRLLVTQQGQHNAILMLDYGVEGQADSLAAIMAEVIAQVSWMAQAGRFGRRVLCANTGAFVLMPAALFNPEMAGAYLQYVQSDFTGLEPYFYKYPGGMVQLYTYPSALARMVKGLTKAQPWLLLHQSSSLLHHFLQLAYSDEGQDLPMIFAGLWADTLWLGAKQGGQLLLFNGYHAPTVNQAAYFALFAAQQLSLDLGQTTVLLAGNDARIQELSTQLSSAAPHVRLAPGPANFGYSLLAPTFEPNYWLDLSAAHYLR